MDKRMLLATLIATGCQAHANLKAQTYGTCDAIKHCDQPNFYDCVKGFCQHKSVWPVSPMEWLGYVVITVLMSLCNVAGIGGGAIDQPIMQVFFKFQIKEAVALSSMVILFGSVARFFYQLRHKHPEKPNTVMVDYSLATIMISTTLAGSQIGNSLFLQVFPPLIIQSCLEALLLFLAVQSLFKAMQLHREEKRQAQAKIDEETNSNFQYNRTSLNAQSLIEATTMDTQADPSSSPEEKPKKQEFGVNKHESELTIEINGTTFELGVSDQQDQELKELSELAAREQSHAQWLKQSVSCALIGLCIFMNLSLGSSSTPSIDGIRLCSPMYWGIQGAFIVVCCVVTWLCIILNKKEQDLRRKYRVNYIDGEIIFEGSALTKLLTIGFVGGWVAGALGLGGGSIYNPALLAMGVNPRVAASTGMYLVIFSCINSTVLNWIGGLLDFQYGAVIGLWVVCGSLLGMYFADSYVKKSGKQSVFVWLLCLVFFIAAGGTPFVAYDQLSGLKAQGQNIMAFISPCAP